MSLLVAGLVVASPAEALTEARIVNVSCSGMRVVQTGLPPRTAFRVEAIDARDGSRLAEREARSTEAGRLDVRIHVDLHGVHRLHGEVSKVNSPKAEYGEADVSLDRHCRVTGTQPVALPSTQTPGAPATAAPTKGSGDGTWLAVAVGAGVLALVAGLLLGRRRRSRS